MAQGFYSDQTVTPLTTTYQEFVYPFQGKNVLLHNDDATNNIIVSLDGTATLLTVKPSETDQFQLINDMTNVLFMKSSAGAPNYRLTVIG